MTIAPRFITDEKLAEIQALLRAGPSVKTVAILAKVNERNLRRWIAAGTLEFDSNYNNPVMVKQANDLLLQGCTVHHIAAIIGSMANSINGWIRQGKIGTK